MHYRCLTSQRPSSSGRSKHWILEEARLFGGDHQAVLPLDRAEQPHVKTPRSQVQKGDIETFGLAGQSAAQVLIGQRLQKFT